MLFEHRLEGRSVRWYTDNKNVVDIVIKWSGNSACQEKALEIRIVCEENNVKMYPAWISRRENRQVDRLSRTSDSDDWHM